MTLLKSYFSQAPGDSSPSWLQVKFCDFIFLEFMVEKILLFAVIIAFNSGGNKRELMPSSKKPAWFGNALSNSGKCGNMLHVTTFTFFRNCIQVLLVALLP